MPNLEEKIIRQAMRAKQLNAEILNGIKRQFLRLETEKNHIPTTAELLKSYHILVQTNKIRPNQKLEKILVKRAVRTLSGVAVITVLTKPFPCPGECVYCPNDANMPKSYIADEPAAARALSLRFDPYEQVRRRIIALHDNGHPTDKIELIVKGGSWNAYPIHYQYWFILRCFQAANHNQIKLGQKQTLAYLRRALIRSQNKNENAPHRIIGLTLETRPDLISVSTITTMRTLGCTRVEIGAQTTDDKILHLIKRGHDTTAIKNANRLLRLYGYKVDFHLMPQLPGTTPQRDLKMLRTIFSDHDLRPDMIKIYPCTVVKNTELHCWLKNKKYHPYSDEQLITVLKTIKSELPEYVRLSRLIRDIPGNHIQAGNRMTNLRQIIQQKMSTEHLICRCLRCREIGHRVTTQLSTNAPRLFVQQYEVTNGQEYFLSFEDPARQAVFAFCRLRLDPQGIYPAFIRELHTYGQTLMIGARHKTASQHRGLGKKLLKAAEKITTQNHYHQIAVISGVGVRDYYRKSGYSKKGTYMVKCL